MEGPVEAIVSFAGLGNVSENATTAELAEAFRALHFVRQPTTVDLRPLFVELMQRGVEVALEPYGQDLVREGREARAKRAVVASPLDQPVPFDDGVSPEMHTYHYVVRDDNPLRVGLLDALAAVMPDSVRVLHCGPCCQRSIERVLTLLPNLAVLTLGTCYNFFGRLSIPPHPSLRRLVWRLDFFDSLTPDYDPELVAAPAEAVVRACPTLASVDLNSWLGFAFPSLLARVAAGPQLKTLRSRLELVEDDMPMSFSRRQWQQFLMNCGGLTELELRGLSGLMDARDAHFLGRELTRLVLIAPYGQVGGGGDESDEDMEEEADESDAVVSPVAGCPRLSELAIMGGSEQLTDVLLLPLIEHASVLRSLKLGCSGAKRAAMHAVQRHGESLRELVLPLDALDEELLVSIARATHLESLAFLRGWESCYGDLPPVVGFPLRALARVLPQLHCLLTLQVEFGPDCCDASLVQFLDAAGSLPQLQCLSIMFSHEPVAGQSLESSIDVARQCCESVCTPSRFPRLQQLVLPLMIVMVLPGVPHAGTVFEDALLRATDNRVALCRGTLAFPWQRLCFSGYENGSPLQLAVQGTAVGSRPVEGSQDLAMFLLCVPRALGEPPPPEQARVDPAIESYLQTPTVTLSMAVKASRGFGFGFGASLTPNVGPAQPSTLSIDTILAVLSSLSQCAGEAAVLKELKVGVDSDDALRRVLLAITAVISAHRLTISSVVVHDVKTGGHGSQHLAPDGDELYSLLFGQPFLHSLAQSVRLLPVSKPGNLATLTLQIWPRCASALSLAAFVSFCGMLQEPIQATCLAYFGMTGLPSRQPEHLKEAARSLLHSNCRVRGEATTWLDEYGALTHVAPPVSRAFLDAMMREDAIEQRAFALAAGVLRDGGELRVALRGYEAVAASLKLHTSNTMLEGQLVDEKTDVLFDWTPEAKDSISRNPDPAAPLASEWALQCGGEVKCLLACRRGSGAVAVVCKGALLVLKDYVVNGRYAFEEDANAVAFWEDTVLFRKAGAMHLLRLGGEAKKCFDDSSQYAPPQLLDNCSKVLCTSDKGVATIHSLAGDAKPESAKLGGECTLCFTSNVPGDVDVYFVAGFNTTVVKRASAASLKTAATVVLKGEAYKMHDGHVGGMWVTRRLLIVLLDQTLVVLDRLQNHAVLGSAWIGGTPSGFGQSLASMATRADDSCVLALGVAATRRRRKQQQREGTGESTVAVFGVCQGSHVIERRLDVFVSGRVEPAVDAAGRFVVDNGAGDVRILEATAKDSPPFDFAREAALYAALQKAQSLVEKQRATPAEVLAVIRSSEAAWLAPRVLMYCIAMQRGGLAAAILRECAALIDWSWRDESGTAAPLLFLHLQMGRGVALSQLRRPLLLELLGCAVASCSWELIPPMVKVAPSVGMEYLELLVRCAGAKLFGLAMGLSRAEDVLPAVEAVIDCVVLADSDYDKIPAFAERFRTMGLESLAARLEAKGQLPVARCSHPTLARRLMGAVAACPAGFEKLRLFVGELRAAQLLIPAVVEGDALPHDSSPEALVWGHALTSPLIAAARDKEMDDTDRVQLVRFLLEEAGCNVNAAPFGQHVAELTKSVAVLRLLLHHPAVDLSKSRLLFALAGGTHGWQLQGDGGEGLELVRLELRRFPALAAVMMSGYTIGAYARSQLDTMRANAAHTGNATPLQSPFVIFLQGLAAETE